MSYYRHTQVGGLKEAQNKIAGMSCYESPHPPPPLYEGEELISYFIPARRYLIQTLTKNIMMAYLTDISNSLECAFFQQRRAFWLCDILYKGADECGPHPSGQLHHGYQLDALSSCTGTKTLSSQCVQNIVLNQNIFIEKDTKWSFTQHKLGVMAIYMDGKNLTH